MATIIFEDILKRQWKTINKEDVDVVEAIKPFIESDTLNIHIGTDAQAMGGHGNCDYVIVICVHDIDLGARRVCYYKFKKVETNSLWEKLFNETMLSLQAAVEISEILPEIKGRIVVHVDANTDSKHRSSEHVKNLAGMVMGYGFRYLLKPDSWASSHAADHIVKNKNSR